MNNISKYIIEKLKLDKDSKLEKEKAAKRPSEADYYVCYLDKGPKTYLHCKWLGVYEKNEKGRKEAEADADRYGFGDNTPGWKRIPGVKTRSQITTVATNKGVDEYQWY